MPRFLRHFQIGLFSLFGLLISHTAHADPVSHHQAALEAMEAIGVGKSMYASVDRMMQMQFKNLPPEAKKYRKKIWEFYYKVINWEKTKDEYAKIYEEAFTEEELRWMIKFYQSKLGQKQLQMMPVMIDKSQKILERRLKEREPEMQQIMQEIKADIQKQRQSIKKAH